MKHQLRFVSGTEEITPLQGSTWACPLVPQDTHNQLSDPRKEAESKVAQKALDSHCQLHPTDLTSHHVKNKRALRAVAAGGKKGRKSMVQTSGILPQENGSEGQDLTKQTVLIIHRPDAAKDRSRCFSTTLRNFIGLI